METTVFLMSDWDFKVYFRISKTTIDYKPILFINNISFFVKHLLQFLGIKLEVYEL